MSRLHVLYRCFDDRAVCLYIGATTQPGVRFRKHADTKDWWCEVVNIQLEHHASRDALERAEQEAIASEGPVFNIAHNTRRLEAFLRYYDDLDPDDEIEDLEDIDP